MYFSAVTLAILDPFSGISGDMLLGALVHAGLEPAWLGALPARLGLDDVTVGVREVQRGALSCIKVDFGIPEQPHGRHLDEIRALLDGAAIPQEVRERSMSAFELLAAEEGRIHGVPSAEVHLHEVGAVDAILDIVGGIWGLSELGVSRVCCGTISLGDGFVRSAHGVLPVPAPATLRLLEGVAVRPGPEGTGELVTPTGAVLVRVLSTGAPPSRYVPRRSGYGAGTKDLLGRPNALRLVLADEVGGEGVERLVMLACDVDDMTPEHLAWSAEVLREAGALDVVQVATLMKKGRGGTRLEVLVREGEVGRFEALLFTHTSTLGVRRTEVERRALPREFRQVEVLGHAVRVKVAATPNGASRGKAEFEDVRAVAAATGRTLADVAALARAAAEREG